MVKTMLMRKRLMIALAVLIPTLALLMILGIMLITESARSVGSWVSYQGSCLDNRGGAADLAAVERGAQITVPPSASNVTADSDALQDCLVLVQFDMASTELDMFTASTHVQNVRPVIGAELSSLIESQQNIDDTWTIDAEKTYLYGSGRNQNGVSQQIAIKTLSSTTLRVYVITFLP